MAKHYVYAALIFYLAVTNLHSSVVWYIIVNIATTVLEL